MFVINFGPGSGGCGGALSTSYAAHVAGSTVSEADYRQIEDEAGNSGKGTKTKEFRLQTQFIF